VISLFAREVDCVIASFAKRSIAHPTCCAACRSRFRACKSVVDRASDLLRGVPIA
jgi:hypothetical protein